MSEYQYYEFVALDQPLSAKQMAQLRALSTRAEISPTRFWNEYQGGDFKGDPASLMKRYFDAHLYFANWGSRRLMLRMPMESIDPKRLKAYFPKGSAAQLTSAGDHVLADLTSDAEGEDYDEDQGELAPLLQLRAELMQGDLRVAYLAWLLAVQTGEVDEGDTEPPVPAGLAALTTAQDAMIQFLRIDVDLVAAASRDSAALEDNRKPLLRHVLALSAKEKDAWLKRALEDPSLPLGAELMRTFVSRKPVEERRGRRTVAALHAQAEECRVAREQLEASRHQRAQAAAEAARKRHLTKLADDVDGAWKKLTKLVEHSEYDQALTLAVDLRDLAALEGEQDAFATRFEALRKAQIRRRGFFDRWKYAQPRT